MWLLLGRYDRDFASAGPARVSVSDRAWADFFCAWRGRVLNRSTPAWSAPGLRRALLRPPILQVFDLYVTVGCVDGERRASAI